MTALNANILIVEDDESFGYILSEYLNMHEMRCTWVKSSEEAVDALTNRLFDLAIFDIMLPGKNGFELAEIVQRSHPNLPFVFLSAKALKVDQLRGFKAGAFDYITKPVDEELLLAKVRSLLQLTRNSPTERRREEFQIGAYQFRPEEQSLTLGEESIQLTTRESELLKLLAENENQLLRRNEALKMIWGESDEFSRRSMDVFISHLRKYLSMDPEISIQNVHGKGFILRTGRRGSGAPKEGE